MREIDRRSDIYSMGAILYESLTGRLAFASENVGDLIIQIVTARLRPVHELNPAIPRPISDVVSKAMARVPADRFQDAPSMQQALIDAVQSSLGALPAMLSDMPPMPIPTRSGEVKVERARTFEFRVDTPVKVATEAPAAEVDALPPPPKVPDEALARPAQSRNLMIAGGLLLLASASAITLLALRASPRWVDATAHVPAAELHPAAEPTAAAEASSIQVELRGVPRGAVITVDGAPAPGPVLELPRDGRNRVIRVAATGKTPWQAVHHASASASYEVMLPDSEPAARPTSSAARSSGASHAKPHKKPPSALKRLDF
jgi:serine/threonine-protein kinase